MTLVFVSLVSLYLAHSNQKGSTLDDSIATVLLADGILFVAVRNFQDSNSSLLRRNSKEQQPGKFLHIMPCFRNVFNYRPTKPVTKILFGLSQISQRHISISELWRMSIKSQDVSKKSQVGTTN